MSRHLTTKTQYAVAAMLELAKANLHEKDVLSIATISESQSIDACYLSMIFSNLRKQKLVLSTRGLHGGYKLAKSTADIAISEIMNAVGEKIRMTRCHDKQEGCTKSGQKCSAHNMWSTLEDRIERYFASITLQDLVVGKLDLLELDEVRKNACLF